MAYVGFIAGGLDVAMNAQGVEVEHVSAAVFTAVINTTPVPTMRNR